MLLDIILLYSFFLLPFSYFLYIINMTFFCQEETILGLVHQNVYFYKFWRKYKLYFDVEILYGKFKEHNKKSVYALYLSLIHISEPTRPY